MLNLMRRIVTAFLYDEDMALRWVSVGSVSLGAVLTNGGAVPGTSIVLPGLAWAYPAGPWIALLGVVLPSIAGSVAKAPAAKP